jgi:hypothetical protein
MRGPNCRANLPLPCGSDPQLVVVSGSRRIRQHQPIQTDCQRPVAELLHRCVLAFDQLERPWLLDKLAIPKVSARLPTPVG